jgi:hypothetical protein
MTMPAAFAQSGHVPMSVGTPTVDANGVKYYPVRSVYQGSQQQIIRVLEPTSPPAGKPRRLLYVLPVEAGVDTLSSSYSDGLEELRLLGVPNQFNMTLIAPSFGYEPWYGDNISDAKEMESFIIDDLVPFGDTFAQGTIPQRYLIGFSKSGNGALFLILRHPGVFNAAAIWDSPTQLNSVSSYLAMPMNFGTQANFNSYIIPTLVSSNARAFQQQIRLWISGDQAAFQSQMISLHNELTAASIPHTWVQGGVRAHSWHSGWLEGAATGLDAIATLTPPAAGTLPPPRTGGQPAGVLPAATSQATLSLATDDNATCRYATTPGVAYGSMANTFSTTGTATHSMLVTGLVSGTNYSYYVRCQDAAGNANSDDYVIAFEVSSTATTVSSTFSGVESVLSENGMWDSPGVWQAAMSKNNGAYAAGVSAARVANPLLSPDQFAEITYDHDPGTTGWVGVMTRIQGSTNGGGYLAFAYSGQVWLYRVDDKESLNWTQLALANVDVSVAPRRLRLESQGSTHRVIFNGVLLLSYTDTNNVYTTGQPGIAAATFSTILSFSGGAVPRTPVRSGGQPTGVLPAAATQTTLSLTTDENATCQYGTTPGVAYGSMANTFSNTGGTAHSTQLTGLVSNTHYMYYVRCQDAAGNANSYDYVIAFTVSSTSTTDSSTFSGVESVLSENWTWGTTGSWQAMSKNNGAYTTGISAAEMVNPLVGPDQFAEITYDHDPGTSGWPGVMTRMQGSTNGSGYLAIAFGGTVRLYRVDDNGGLGWNSLASANVDVSVAPRRLRLESQGNTHRVIFNGVPQITYTDSSNVYTAGQPGIAAATFSTILSFSGGALARTPARSGGQPAGVLPAGTTQTTLSLTTDENATCRYGTTSGVAYGSMVNTFSTTGAMTHSTLLSGLVSGSNYSYFVRCQDAAGNANTDDYVIAFAVSSTSTTASSSFSGVESVLSENGTWSTAGSWQAMSKNNGAYTTAVSAARVANPLLGSDQFAEITYDHDPGTSGWPGVMTRMQSSTNGSGYLAIAFGGTVRLYRVDDNGGLGWNSLASANVDVSVAPRRLRLESQGNTHRVYFNGVLQITFAENVYTAGQPGIAAATFSTILSFSGGTLARTPARSGGQPAGVLPAGTTQTTLSLTTDENATCRYATTSGVAYSSMVNTFSTTGTMAHSTLVSGLVSGSNYSYYVRCQDAAGNANTDDYVIAFTVSSTSTTASSTFSGVESSLSENGTWGTAGSWQPMSKNNGAYTAGLGGERLVNPLVPPDQFAEITYDHDPGTSGWPGVMTRMQGSTNGGGYLAIAYGGSVRLYRVDDNGGLSFTQLASANVDVSVAPRDLRLESQGNTHRVIFNGVLQITCTENVYTAGQPGIAAATFGAILSFSGGAL